MGRGEVNFWSISFPKDWQPQFSIQEKARLELLQECEVSIYINQKGVISPAHLFLVGCMYSQLAMLRYF